MPSIIIAALVTYMVIRALIDCFLVVRLVGRALPRNEREARAVDRHKLLENLTRFRREPKPASPDEPAKQPEEATVRRDGGVW